MPGNLFNDTTFSDYPNAAINDNELFINLNLFKCDPPYNYGQTVIFQIDLAKGYAGLPNLDYKVWGNNITTSTGLPGFTLVPAPNGLGQSNTDGMHFVSTWPDGDDTNVYVYKITKPLLDTSSQLLQYTYKIPKFYVCANGKIKNPVNGIVDSINTGSSVTQSAFLLDNNIHFTFGADFNNGWCGLNYGRINLNTQTAEVKQFGINGTYLSYPAVASFGNNSLEKTSALCYVQADTNILPQTCAISIDDAMSFSNPVVIKTGDTIVDILNANNNPGYAERWGDYSGIQRRYNSPSGLPEVWMAGAYGATNARPASYNTWLAQLLNTIYPTSTTQTTVANTQSKVYPNPVIDIFTTEFYNASQSNVQVYLINNNGQILQTMYNGNMPKGKCSLQFNKGKLATGMYALQILQDNKIMHTHKVVMQ